MIENFVKKDDVIKITEETGALITQERVIDMPTYSFDITDKNIGLNECPFCGCKVEFRDLYKIHQETYTCFELKFRVGCNRCSYTFPKIYTISVYIDLSNTQNPFIVTRDEREEAAEKWNTRAEK